MFCICVPWMQSDTILAQAQVQTSPSADTDADAGGAQVWAYALLVQILDICGHGGKPSKETMQLKSVRH